MRLGLLDVGSSAARLDLVDLNAGRPRANWSHKARTRLAEHTDPDGAVSADGIERTGLAVEECVKAAGTDLPRFVVAYGTSAVRDAANSAEIRRRISDAAGVQTGVFSPRSEAALSYHAARRWAGPSEGRLTTVDIGGGTADVATGKQEYPRKVLTVPFGAATLSREHVVSDPPREEEFRALVDAVASTVPDAFASVAGSDLGRPLALSTVFRQLAVLTESGHRKRIRRPERLHRHKVAAWIPHLAALDHEQRVALPGISRTRSYRALAGSVLAEAMLRVLDLDTVEICPWGLREGLVLRFLEAYEQESKRPRRAVRAAADHILS
ncbi:exopolyphosphatase [Allosaccharopolyspora coralli]|uniref:Exopolyphosphatase n=1 Tax=Allosaccharopolyspora coralli TaxID=2665642 RepID=A0A5Q3Q8N2_9PSEU|nr:exopolyphosphatase [Allosaccharopolyspora coralli]QGK69564.1 exopolyphosphatase [Allosaccharopolyspora coralli]